MIIIAPTHSVDPQTCKRKKIHREINIYNHPKNTSEMTETKTTKDEKREQRRPSQVVSDASNPSKTENEQNAGNYLLNFGVDQVTSNRQD